MTKATRVLSTPPLNSSSNNVIKFDFSLPRKAARKAARAKAEAATVRPAAVSITAGNSRLRKDRREAWRAAEAATRYWRVRLDLESAISIAQNHGLPEGRLHPTIDMDDWMPMVDKYRKAVTEKLLTPAWDVASVTWKRTLLARNDYVIGRYVDQERVERAIKEDLAFLAAHPTRRSINATKKQR
jgi:hypothetical protein